MTEISPKSCRFCLQRCPITASSVDDYLETYKQLTNFKIFNSDIPKRVCDRCKNLIGKLVKFHEICSRTEELLQEFRENCLLQIQQEVMDIDESASMGGADTSYPYFEEEEDSLSLHDEIESTGDLKDTIKQEMDFSAVYIEDPLNGESGGAVETDCDKFVLSFEDKKPYNLPLNQDTEDIENNSQITCPFCNFQDANAVRVRKHEETFHTDKKWFQCPWCPLTHHNLDKLRLHCVKNKYHSQRLAPFTPLICDACTFTCCYQSQMVNHCERMHPEKLLFCDDCGATFVCRDLKLQHLVTQCPNATEKVKIMFKKFLNAEPRSSCGFCDKFFKLPKLVKHLKVCKMRKKAKNGIYSCDACVGIVFKGKKELKKHIVEVHEGSTTFPCEQCGENFSSDELRSHHVQTVHDNENYVCQTCGITFVSRYNMDQHAAMHIEEQNALLNEDPNKTNFNLLPEKSKMSYEMTYNRFLKWCEEKGYLFELTEDVFLSYFQERSSEWKPSTLWSHYSMIKAMHSIKTGCDISQFDAISKFLRKQNVGFQPKQTSTFTQSQIEQFLNEAPDDQYLMLKVAAIMGFFGACRREELCYMQFNNVQESPDMLIVKLPNKNTNTCRTFTVIGSEYISYYKRYVALRPKTIPHGRLFIQYLHKRCTKNPVGVNTFGKMPSKIAEFLNLPEPSQYTGHCFRRSSASLLSAEGEIATIRRQRGQNVYDDDYN